MTNLKRYTLYILNIIDILCFVLAYYPSFFIAFSGLFRDAAVYELINYSTYVQFLIIVILSYVLTNVFSIYNEDDYLERSFFDEAFSCIKMTFFVIAIVIILFYVQKTSVNYSRMFIGIYSCVFIIFDLILRMFVKRVVLPKYKLGDSSEKIVIITDSSQIEALITRLREKKDWRYKTVGAIVTDGWNCDEVLGVPVISDCIEGAEQFIEFETSSVLYSPNSYISPDDRDKTIGIFHQMGKIVHLKLDDIDLKDSYKKLDSLGTVSVMTYLPGKPFAKRKIVIKQILDIIIGIVLLPVFFVVSIIAGLLNLIWSKGPLLLRYVRVGQNGSRFYLYRYRTIHIDAKHRKETGKSVYTPAGFILSKTHLDGLPQILNIISREMSFVGPKPATLPEYLNMNAKARAEYVFKPGIVGGWSVYSSENSIQQTKEWTLFGDLLVAFLAAGRFIIGKSQRSYTLGDYETDAFELCNEIYQQRKPFEYVLTGYVAPNHPIYYFVKRFFDVILSFLGIVLFSPLLLILSILIIADDGGVPFYSHSRIGYHGKRINVYKFRSMRQDAGDITKLLTPEQLKQYYLEFKLENDPRITSIGSFLRKTSLDELPQLFNVLGGSLSLIGPRPIVEKETHYYGNDLEKFFSVKPGLTGYWQAYARNNAGYKDGERQKMELYYIDNQSFCLDMRIFFRTFVTIIRREGSM